MNRWANGKTDKRTDRQKDTQTHGKTDEWINTQIDRHTDGRIDKCTGR